MIWLDELRRLLHTESLNINTVNAPLQRFFCTQIMGDESGKYTEYPPARVYGLVSPPPTHF